jgi:hypothetical protein
MAPWRPSGATTVVLDAIEAVLTEYLDYWPMTARQVYYRLVAQEVLDKTELAYERLTGMLNRARRAGRVDWDAIRDDGTTWLEPASYRNRQAFVATVGYSVDTYRRARLANQPRRLEVWVEAAGMAPQAADAVRDYGVPVFSSGGFNSLTSKKDAAQRAVNDGRPLTILHVGDCDPSGLALVDNLAEDLPALALGLADMPMCPPPRIDIVRLAITPEQAIELDAPSSPQKARDRRGEHMAECWQCEALPPDTLAGIIRDAVRERVDADLFAEMLEIEADERAELREWVAR